MDDRACRSRYNAGIAKTEGNHVEIGGFRQSAPYEHDRHSACVRGTSGSAGRRSGDLEYRTGSGILGALPVFARADSRARRAPVRRATLGTAAPRTPAVRKTAGVSRELPPVLASGYPDPLVIKHRSAPPAAAPGGRIGGRRNCPGLGAALDFRALR